MGLEQPYRLAKARWFAGERERTLLLDLTFMAWMHWADPPWVNGLEEDPDDARVWHEVFTYFGGALATDAGFPYAAGLMASLFPDALGDEDEWKG